MEAWQNEKHYSKGNNTSENQSQDKKFQTSRQCGIRRSGQATTFVVCAVLFLSFQAVVLLTKTAINHRFFQSSLRSVDGFGNSNDFELRNFYFTNV